MLMVNQLTGFGGKTVGPAILGAEAVETFTSSASSFTSGTLAFDTQSAKRQSRYGILGVFALIDSGTPAFTVASPPTIAGIVTTQIEVIEATGRVVGLFYAPVPDPAASTAVCTVDLDGASSRLVMVLWPVYDLEVGVVDTSERSQTGTTTDFPSTDTRADGLAVAIVGGQTVSSTYTWTVLSEQRDATIAGAVTYTAADGVTTGAAIAPVCTGTSGSTVCTGVCASFR